MTTVCDEIEIFKTTNFFADKKYPVTDIDREYIYVARYGYDYYENEELYCIGTTRNLKKKEKIMKKQILNFMYSYVIECIRSNDVIDIINNRIKKEKNTFVRDFVADNDDYRNCFSFNNKFTMRSLLRIITFSMMKHHEKEFNASCDSVKTEMIKNLLVLPLDRRSILLHIKKILVNETSDSDNSSSEY